MMISTWVAMRCSSSISWAARMTVLPAADHWRIESCSQSLPAMSNPLNGSSNTRTGASAMIAPATPSRCRIPVEYPLIRVFGQRSKPQSRSTRRTRRRTLGNSIMPAMNVRYSRPVIDSSPNRPPRNTPTCRPGRSNCPYGRPMTSACPRLGADRPSVMRSVVDFPAPFDPATATT